MVRGDESCSSVVPSPITPVPPSLPLSFSPESFVNKVALLSVSLSLSFSLSQTATTGGDISRGNVSLPSLWPELNLLWSFFRNTGALINPDVPPKFQVYFLFNYYMYFCINLKSRLTVGEAGTIHRRRSLNTNHISSVLIENRDLLILSLLKPKGKEFQEPSAMVGTLVQSCSS